ncbi:MAG: hypothetical protein GF317_00500 [Candidatus Lokiarchaeota archaeon]|nr:hypothetical protein [Candidatus Lokiarchaeota archaeon]MBD3198456.1 hypothetical protein [Candidatus Lokiarchaeota archaeon]
MSEEFKSLVDQSFEKGLNPIWMYTDDYIYGMMAADESGGRWTEISYAFEMDDPLRTVERSADLSYQFLFEELEKGISFYIKDFNVLNLKNFGKSLETLSGPEKVKSLINELITNSSKYSDNFPIIKSAEESSVLKEKV